MSYSEGEMGLVPHTRKYMSAPPNPHKYEPAPTSIYKTKNSARCADLVKLLLPSNRSITIKELAAILAQADRVVEEEFLLGVVEKLCKDGTVIARKISTAGEVQTYYKWIT